MLRFKTANAPKTLKQQMEEARQAREKVVSEVVVKEEVHAIQPQVHKEHPQVQQEPQIAPKETPCIQPPIQPELDEEDIEDRKRIFEKILSMIPEKRRKGTSKMRFYTR